jgi:hypothetical protein
MDSRLIFLHTVWIEKRGWRKICYRPVAIGRDAREALWSTEMAL